MNQRVYPVFFMIIMAAAATLIMTGVEIRLRPRIRLNAKTRLQIARLSGMGLLPEKAGVAAVQRIYANQVREETVKERPVYFGYTEDGRLFSIGMEFQGDAFWGRVVGLISLNPEKTEIVRLVFFEHQETPGLGGRMTEPWFLNQFTGKEVAEPGPAGTYLRWVPEGVDTPGPKDVNAISGATRTSDSLKVILEQALKDFHALNITPPSDAAPATAPGE